MFYTIHTILMTCAIIKISTMRCPIHLRRGQENAMPMVDTGEKAQPVCHAARASEAGRKEAARAQLAPAPSTALQAPCDGSGHQGPSAGAGQPGRWVPVAQ